MKFNINDKKRIVALMIAIFIMGLTLSFLIRLNFGTDPCSTMNLGISSGLGISFGVWSVLFNSILFVFIIIFDRSHIGWGTLANMILIGFIADFFGWIWDKVLLDQIFESILIRITILVPTLIVFIFAAAVYMAVELGTAPYDAIIFIISKKISFIPFRFLRIIWDILACLIGLLVGGKIGIITITLALLLGPVISWVKEKLLKNTFEFQAKY